MARPNPIRKIMASELPSITYQRRKSFRPTLDDVDYAYVIINRYVFENQLKKPKIILKAGRKVWGTCQWLEEEQKSGSWCEIQINDKWFCMQWFMNVLAHEMIHLYQFALKKDTGNHNSTFYSFRPRFKFIGLGLSQ